MHVNRIFNFFNKKGLMNGKNPRIDTPLNFVQVALCSSSEERLSVVESNEFVKMNLPILSYSAYNSGEGGYPFASIVWMSYHLSDLLLSYKTRNENSYDIMLNIPQKGTAQQQSMSYASRCRKYQKEKVSQKVGFTQEEINLYNKYTRKNFSADVFNSKESVINQLLNYGPFSFYFTFNLTNTRVFQSLVAKEIFTLKLQQTLKDIRVMNSYSYHAVLAVGIKKFMVGNKIMYSLKFRNSWGYNWGDKGYGYLELDDGLYTGLLKANNKVGKVAYLSIREPTN